MTTYLELNRKYLTEADELISKADYSQASEKLWGAFVEAVKAIAVLKGERLGTHRSIAQYILKLDKEHPEIRLHDVFAHADKLHTNFHEGHLPPEDVTRSAEIIKTAIEKLKNFM